MIKLTALALVFCSIAWVPSLPSQTAPPAAKKSKATRFEISFSSSLHSAEITNRVLLRITRKKNKWRVAHGKSVLFGVDAEHLKPGAAAIVDENMLGYPLNGQKDIPPGDYLIHAFLNVYTSYIALGHTIWTDVDQCERQNFKRSPGNLLSDAAASKICAPDFSRQMERTVKNATSIKAKSGNMQLTSKTSMFFWRLDV
jgi:hypothetical protein